MSIKIDVRFIIKDHLRTLAYTDGQIRRWDLVTFVVFPALVALLFVYKGWSLNNNVLSTFVNLGSIFTALLISVLLMIFDQAQKIKANIQALPTDTDPNFRLLLSNKSDLMKELFSNISYSIVISVILVFTALFYQLVVGADLPFSKIHWFAKYILMPLNVFLVVNLLLTVLMVIKRTYILMNNL